MPYGFNNPDVFLFIILQKSLVAGSGKRRGMSIVTPPTADAATPVGAITMTFFPLSCIADTNAFVSDVFPRILFLQKNEEITAGSLL